MIALVQHDVDILLQCIDAKNFLSPGSISIASIKDLE
jgi:hypothetical protein